MNQSQPLLALDALVLDTETTGLDPTRARIVQIGCIALRRGSIDAASAHARHCNPGEPIPPATTKIHGITDADVADAPDFRALYGDLRARLGEHVIIGHNIGFDLAVIGRECRLAGLEPPVNRLLDTRLLGEIAFPRLGGFTLDALASHLGIAAESRHDALADARITAAVFLALLPQLKAVGIRTLGEAEAACRRKSELIDQLSRAGWADPVRPAAGETALERIDAFPFRHRVEDIASRPPIWLPPTATLGEATELMADRSISSVFVSAQGDALVQPIGIITERDVIRLIGQGGAGALDEPIGPRATRPLLTVPAGAFIYRAIGRMEARRIRHLGVTDEAGTVIGAISARDLLRLRSSDAMALGDAIDEAASLGDIAAAWGRMPLVAGRLMIEGVSAREIAAVISREIGALTRRAAMEAEKHLAREGYGAPPVPYAVLILGSGGRGESLLIPDQDNAIVYAPPAPDEAEAIRRWFLALGEVMTEVLDSVGIPYCKGKVMASNPAWSGSIEDWRARIRSWTETTTPDDLLSVDIFFDCRHVHGDHAMAQSLIAYAQQAAHQARPMVKLLADQIGQWGSPIGLFGRLKTEEGRVDLKKNGLLPVVSTARCLALAHGIRARATVARISALREMQLGADSDLELLDRAHNALSGFVLRQQLSDIAAGIPPSTKVDPARLSRSDLALLKDLLSGISSAPTVAHDLLFAEAKSG